MQFLFSQLVSLGFKASDPMSVAEQLQWRISTLIFRIPHQVVSFRIKTVHISLLFITCNFFKTWDADRVGLGMEVERECPGRRVTSIKVGLRGWTH